MRRSDFSFQLPGELIAQQPLAERSASRMLTLDGISGSVTDQQFCDLPEFLRPDDLLVFNNTRVIKARLYGQKDTGGRVEILIERILGEYEILAQIRASKSPKPGSIIYVDGEKDAKLEVHDRVGEFFLVRLSVSHNFSDFLEIYGHWPLPPYIKREDLESDAERYQTVYSKTPGAVAAPTAGLHFDPAMLGRLQEAGIRQQFVTLHVGAGTFQPVRVDDLSQHKMHSEWLEVTESVCDAIRETRQQGGRVIAVGTTSLRALEAASEPGECQPFTGDTRIFIQPGYQFKSVDALITNFHLPESTLLMLICAFAGYDNVMQAYQHAITERYRFFSYGDVCFLTSNRNSQEALS